MKYYNNSVVSKYDTLANGNAQVGATITVYYAGTRELANLFDSNSQSVGNPVLTDNNGNYGFYVADGVYDIIINEGKPGSLALKNEEIKEVKAVEQVDEFPVVAVSEDTASLLQSQSGSFIVFNSPNLCTLTLPDNLNIGTAILACNVGGGGVTLSTVSDSINGAETLQDALGQITVCKVTSTVWQSSERPSTTTLSLESFDTATLWDSFWKGDTVTRSSSPENGDNFYVESNATVGDTALGGVERSGSGKWEIQFDVEGTASGSVQLDSCFGIADAVTYLEISAYKSASGDSAMLCFADLPPTGAYLLTNSNGTINSVDLGLSSISTPCTINILVDLDNNKMKAKINGFELPAEVNLTPGILWRAMASCIDGTGKIGLRVVDNFTPTAGYKPWNQMS